MILCVCPNPAIDKLVFTKTFFKGATNRLFNEKPYPGGKGVHVALGVKELGEEVSLLGFWGGSTGHWIKQQCEAQGISSYGPTLDEWSRTCLTLKTNDEYDETEILGTGPKIDTIHYRQFLRDFERLLGQASLVCMSGSWPSNEHGFNFSELIEIARRSKIKSIIDCSGASFSHALAKNPFGVHVNHHEAFEIYSTYHLGTLFSNLEKHSNLVALTCGEKGLYLSDGKKIVHALSKVNHVLSTVGCGDSLLAGLAVAHVRRYNLIETASLAASCGAANCIREDLGMFFKEDVEKLLSECVVVDYLKKNEIER